MQIRLVKMDELDKVMEIIADAIKLLSKDSLQWQQGYPNTDTMRNDISRNELYGYYDDNGTLLGVVALVIGLNEHYAKIYDGSWIIPHNENDLVVHRIAVRSGYHHLKIGDALMKYATEFALKHHISSIKVDTHVKNKPMQTLCLNNGYKYVGTILLLRDELDNSRMAFEKVL